MAEVGGMHAHKITEIEGLNQGLASLLKMIQDLQNEVKDLKDLLEVKDAESD